jgi:hypothetical protein
MFPYNGDMQKHELRFLIPKDLYKRYKIICTKMDLSLAKQGTEIIREFVEIQEENLKKIEGAKND